MSLPGLIGTAHKNGAMPADWYRMNVLIHYDPSQVRTLRDVVLR
jgi:hypothetical protein